ncbi:hypothetical protein Dsin_006658 [Dipteronia sinensis]|uniref:GDSL esterase/lipase n=1 Tax=Dipteronia sinensis TaxID=43782 RepID=A0AAE0AYT0_9ROSI|nr:hypothetical protein Dsin_006658 [Dipteronia sinensis]
MEPRKLLSSLFYFSLLSLLSGNQKVVGSAHHHHHHKHRHLFDFKLSKLFVFGDSYADTGNLGRSVGRSWKEPYGITFPGKPTGRFSSGRVLTDYLAKFVGIKSPIPYKLRRVGGKYLTNGMNFAYGGTGVFQSTSPLPNMTTQIGFFQQLIKEEVYNSLEIQQSSAAILGFPSFITQVVKELVLNLKRIQGLGLKKVAVTTLQPSGCVPQITVASSFQKCNGTLNSLASFHNLLLKQSVAKLNNETKETTIVIIDLYSAFMTVFNNKSDHLGSSKFENPLKPCCVGISNGDLCGNVDESGTKKYKVCENPEAAFFWDTVHPTQEGWRSVYSALQANLQQLY